MGSSAKKDRERPAEDVHVPETVGKWWSVTKVATAVAVLQLADEGRLRLERSSAYPWIMSL